MLYQGVIGHRDILLLHFHYSIPLHGCRSSGFQENWRVSFRIYIHFHFRLSPYLSWFCAKYLNHIFSNICKEKIHWKGNFAKANNAETCAESPHLVLDIALDMSIKIVFSFRHLHDVQVSLLQWLYFICAIITF